MPDEVKVNDEVFRSPVSFQQADENYKAVHGPIPGKVVYVHPKKRYHIVEFSVGGKTIRESFQGVAR